MIVFETLTQEQRDDYANSLELEWQVNCCPGIPATLKPARHLVVSTTINPEPFDWSHTW